MKVKVGDRVHFYDLSGRLVSDIVRGHEQKVISYKAYHADHPVNIPALLLTTYTWVPESEIV